MNARTGAGARNHLNPESQGEPGELLAWLPFFGVMNGLSVDVEHAAVTQTMALEGQAVEALPTDRADAIDDLIRSPGRLLWRTDLE